MFNYLGKFLGLSEQGVRTIRKAASLSCLRFLTYMIPMMVVLYFSNNLLNGIYYSPLFYIALVIATIILVFIAERLSYNANYSATYKESRALRFKVLKRFKELPMSYFSRHNLSDFSQTVLKDVADVEMALSHGIADAIGYSLFFIIMSILLLMGNVSLALTIIIPIILSIAFFFIATGGVIQKNSLYYNSLRDNAEAFQETIETQQEILSFGQEEKVRDKVYKLLEKNEKNQSNTELFAGMFLYGSNSLILISVLATIIVGYSLYSQGEVPLILFIGYFLASLKISESIGTLFIYLATVMHMQKAFQRLKSINNQEIRGGKVVEFQDFSIEAKNLHFTYKDQEVLKGLDFSIDNKEICALIGPSGSGKTTLLKVLASLLDYKEGSIKIGGEELKELNPDSIYQQISYVFQDTILYNDSILENIRLGKQNASDEEVLRAAKAANVDEFANKLPQGFNTLIGENGSLLSGGERQRISIARAFLKNSPILILDEISASLDVENEMKIQESLQELVKDKTVVITSHRLKSIENVDKILLLEDGKLVASGKHEELKLSSPLYQRMLAHSQQSEDFIYNS